jgi:exodeoxyribonuclease VII large subunit
MAASKKRAGFGAVAGRLRPEALLALLARRREQSLSLMRALDTARARRVERASDRVGALSARLAPALARVISDAARKTGEGRAKLVLLDARLQAAPSARLAALSQRLEALDRIRTTLGYAETLKRGYAVVRGDGHVVTSKAAAEKALSVEVEFADGRLVLGGKGPRKTKAEGGPTQGSLF